MPRGRGGEVRIQWFIDRVMNQTNITLRARVKLAVNLTRDYIVRNISTRVRITRGPRGGRVVTGRSKPGEWPKLETGNLMRSIITDTRRITRDIYEGYVGTTVDYGLILEFRRDRKLLERGLMDMLPHIRTIITRRIR